MWLGKQGLAFRGHFEHEQSKNKGNFLELCDFKAKDLPSLGTFLSRQFHYIYICALLLSQTQFSSGVSLSKNSCRSRIYRDSKNSVCVLWGLSKEAPSLPAYSRQSHKDHTQKTMWDEVAPPLCIFQGHKNIIYCAFNFSIDSGWRSYK